MLNAIKTISIAVVGIALLVGFMGSHSREGTRVAEAQPVITLADFYALSDGMSYDQVADILKSPGVVLSRNTMPGVPGYMDPVTTVMVQWENPGVFAGNMNAMFQNGKMISKAQFGLR